MIISNAQSPTKLFNNPHRLAVSIPVVSHCGLVLGMYHSTDYAMLKNIVQKGRGGFLPLSTNICESRTLFSGVSSGKIDIILAYNLLN